MGIEETSKIKSAMIFEIIGKPAEHLVKTLEDIIKKIDEEKGVEVMNKKIAEPVLMKDSKDFYVTHAEIEIEVEEIIIIALLMFKYMPANVEIISPESIKLSNTSWSEIFTELTRRLHSYDEVARVLQMQKAELEKKLKENSENKKSEKK